LGAGASPGAGLTATDWGLVGAVVLEIKLYRRRLHLLAAEGVESLATAEYEAATSSLTTSIRLQSRLATTISTVDHQKLKPGSE
jgi:hypothetical protein